MNRRPTLLALAATVLLAGCGGGGGAAAPRCGDGHLDAGEACDDGNAAAGDGCSPACALECGDGLVQAGEACDGADLAGQGCATLGMGFAGGVLSCSATCTLVTSACEGPPGACGNGEVDGQEQCDDGGAVDGDGCSATCELEDPSTGWLAPGGGIGEGHGP